MKTLIITLEYPPQVGGIASMVYNLANHLSATDVVVLAPVTANDQEFDSSQLFCTVRINPYWPFFWPRWTRILGQVVQLVKQKKVEKIVIHHILPIGYVALFMWWVYHVPFVVFFHGSDVDTLRRHSLHRFFASFICRRAKQVVVNSLFLKNKLETTIALTAPVAIVYPCPGDHFFQTIDSEILNQTKRQLAVEGKTVLLSVSRIDEGKGYPHIVRLLPRLLVAVPNLVWVVVGGGPKYQEVITMVRAAHLEGVVRFLGEVPNLELPRYFQVANVFMLLTHRDEHSEEGLGGVFLEAAASGLPVIAGRVGGVDEALKNGETGYSFEVHQTDEICAAATELLVNKVRAEKMGACGKLWVEENFRLEKQFQHIRF